jgi:hypothetical protein
LNKRLVSVPLVLCTIIITLQSKADIDIYTKWKIELEFANMIHASHIN